MARPCASMASSVAGPSLVIYPGTFNPFHYGHLEAVLAAAKTDLATGMQAPTPVRSVLVVLAADASNPHKPQPAPAEHRAQLAQQGAVGGVLEVQRGEQGDQAQRAQAGAAGICVGCEGSERVRVGERHEGQGRAARPPP